METILIQSFRNALELVRFSHTIFAMPFALASMILAANGLPSWNIVTLIIVCMVFARTAAMTFNRIVDRKIDAKNPRTKNRHLASEQMPLWQAITLLIVSSVLFIVGAFFLNPMAAWLSVPTLLFLLSYSFGKKIGWFCHFHLGLALGLSPLGAWVAVRGFLDWIPVWLGLMLLFWVSGFDIIYALQDEDFDRKEGLHSIPVRFGSHKAQVLAGVSHFFLIFSSCVGTIVFQLGWIGWSLCASMSVVLLFIHFGRKTNSLDDLNQDFFLANAVLSILVLIASVLLVLQK